MPWHAVISFEVMTNASFNLVRSAHVPSPAFTPQAYSLPWQCPWNVGQFLRDYTAQHPRRQPSSYYKKGKAVSQYTCGGAGGEKRYSSYSLTTSALDGVSGQRHVPVAVYLRGKDPGANWTGGWVGPRAVLDSEARGKILCLCRASKLDRPVVQSVARHYTVWTTPAPVVLYTGIK
jgi:hypothetical protein